MRFKLSLGNIRRSMRDYAVYFFTLIIGVSVFYVFNAIETQTAFMRVDASTHAMADLLRSMLSGVSIFVAGVLGLLIVYASRFLMKRRNKEFALYMLLGMSKWQVSSILLTETIIIGLGSLIVGMLAGVGLSQLMSVLVVSLFKADMSDFHFTVSTGAMVKTCIYFGIMYLVVMLFNSFMIGKCKLIDLINSGKRNEKLHSKNLLLCVLVFIVSAALLGTAYYLVAFRDDLLTQKKLIACIAAGAVSTYFIFWSVSGMLLRLTMSMKRFYFNGLNSFTFRQLSGKVNTMVMSMTVICLMLFLTICTLCAAFSIRNSMNETVDELCKADMQLYGMSMESTADLDAVDMCSELGFDVTSYLADGYSKAAVYEDAAFTGGTFYGEAFNDEAVGLSDYAKQVRENSSEMVMTVSDYNELAAFLGNETLELGAGEYILLCDFDGEKEIRDYTLKNYGGDITVFGKQLRSKFDHCVNGYFMMSSIHMNTGLFIVPDDVVDPNCKMMDMITGNYKGDPEAVEAEIQSAWAEVTQSEDSDTAVSLSTSRDMMKQTVGLTAIVTLLGLYVGMVFLISSGAILALREMSDSVDSSTRYTMLRKLGVEEKSISKSLFGQTGVFFLLPLLLGMVHSIFGLRFGQQAMNVIGLNNMGVSALITGIIILLIYGGYFLITYFCSRTIIRSNNN